MSANASLLKTLRVARTCEYNARRHYERVASASSLEVSPEMYHPLSISRDVVLDIRIRERMINHHQLKLSFPCV